MFKAWSMEINTGVAFAPWTHIHTYVYIYTFVPAHRNLPFAPCPWTHGLGRSHNSGAALDCEQGPLGCIARVFCVPRRHQKWPWPARGDHCMLRTSCFLVLNFYNSRGHTFDTFWLKPELYDPRLPMDTLQTLSVFCMCDIAIV